MKRPIPEGVTAPNDKATILGWGDEIQSAGGFEGWLYLPALPGHGWIGPARMDGSLSTGLYAALSDSGVVRLNRESKWKLEDHDYMGELSDDAGSEVARLNQEAHAVDWSKETHDSYEAKLKGEDPRDGVIRGLLDALKRITDRDTGSMFSHDEGEMFDIAESALALAKEKGFE